jgi:predicted nuclease of predicted toxin-antitoxin system
VKFLHDVCVPSRSLTAFLTAEVHEVLPADPESTDSQLLNFAFQDERLLVTEDKDFGELVFVQRLPHGPIVRMVELNVDVQVRALAELLARHGSELSMRVIIIVSRGRIRIHRQT